MASAMFDTLYPLKPGSTTERPGLKYLGVTTIVGVTGDSQSRHRPLFPRPCCTLIQIHAPTSHNQPTACLTALQKYGGLRGLFDGVKSKNDQRLVFTIDVLRRHDDPKYAPGVYQYHDLLVSNVDMKRLLDAHGHLIRVVSYEHFKTTSRCRWL